MIKSKTNNDDDDDNNVHLSGAHQRAENSNLALIDDVSFPDVVPCTLSAPTLRFDLTKLKKDTTDPGTYKQFTIRKRFH